MNRFKFFSLQDNMGNDALQIILGIFCCWNNSIFSLLHSGPEITISKFCQVFRICEFSSKLTNFRTHEFQARRWTVETVSAFASVEFAITRIVSDPWRHRIQNTIVSIRFETRRSEISIVSLLFLTLKTNSDI